MSRSPRAVAAAATSLANRRLLLGSLMTSSTTRTPSFSRSSLACASLAGQSFRTRRSYHEHVASQSNTDSSHKDDSGDLDYDFLEDTDGDDDSDDNDDDLSQDQPWKSLLELPSRAVWRASDPHPPDPVMVARDGVLNAGGATAKQLKRTYAGIVVTQRALAERRERERRRIINRAHYSRRAQQRDEDTPPVFYGKMETLAQLRNRLGPNYAITKRVLEETKSLLGYSLYASDDNNKNGSKSNSAAKNGWRPKRIIDMGIGVGSASAAVLDVFENDVEWVHGIDPSRCMRECAKSFLEEIMEQKTKQQPPQDGSTGAQQQQQTRVNPPRLTLTGSISADASSSTFDMALLTYTATDLPQVASSLAAAAILWQKLAHNGVFIMIEPGTPDGFNSVRSVRTMLLDCCPPHSASDDDENDDDDNVANKAGDQCHIIAPCTHSGTCPMERYQHDFFRQKNPKTQMNVQPTNEIDVMDGDEDVDNWDDEEWDSMKTSTRGPGMTEATEFLSGRFCSFVQTMSTGSHLRKGEKFSYIVAQKRIPSEETSDYHGDRAPLSSFRDDRLRDLLTSVYHANEESDTGDEEGTDKQQRRVQALFEEAQTLKTKYLDSEEDDLGLEFMQGGVNRASFGRIIRAPLKKRGHVMIDYCAAPGRLMRTRVSKALDYTVAPGLYTAARKSRWGGLWPDVATGALDYFKEESDEESSTK